MRAIFTPRAEHQLDALYGRIANDAGESRADMYVSRLLDYCERVTMLPRRGAARDDVLPGLRVTAFERRVTIAYLVTADSLLIEDLDPFRTAEARLGIDDVARTGPTASRPPVAPPPRLRLTQPPLTPVHFRPPLFYSTHRLSPGGTLRAFERGIETVALGSIAVGLAVLALKAAAAHLTGSAAFFSDALETVVNVAASVIAWIALRFAALPPDANHPYGHDKAEFLAAVVEGVLIVVAALSIFERAWSSWSNPHPLASPLTGMALNGASAVLNLAWAAILLRTANRHRSPALQADGRHLLADVVTSLGILAGVTLVLLTGNLRIDAIAAALTGIYVLLSGMHLIQGSVAGLMDAAPDDATLARIRALVSANAGGAIEAHDLRTRRAGRINFLQFHLVVPGSMTVSESHAICDRIEAALEADMAHLVVNIHVEPEEKAKQHGVPVL